MAFTVFIVAFFETALLGDDFLRFWLLSLSQPLQLFLRCTCSYYCRLFHTTRVITAGSLLWTFFVRMRTESTTAFSLFFFSLARKTFVVFQNKHLMTGGLKAPRSG
jgi:hypothetical protein